MSDDYVKPERHPLDPDAEMNTMSDEIQAMSAPPCASPSLDGEKHCVLPSGHSSWHENGNHAWPRGDIPSRHHTAETYQLDRIEGKMKELIRGVNEIGESQQAMMAYVVEFIETMQKQLSGGGLLKMMMGGKNDG